MKLADEHNSIAMSLKVHVYSQDILESGAVRDPEPWLDVRVDAHTEAGSWTCEEPSLQVSEVRYLIRWLRATATRQPFDQPGVFEEPTIDMDFLGMDGPLYRVRFFLEQECRPPWLGGITWDPPSPPIDMSVTGDALESAASDLEEQLKALMLT